MIDLRRLFAPRSSAPAEETPEARFGFAVVGLGRIAEHFLKGVQDSPAVRVAELVSGSPEKAHSLARRYNVPHTMGYDAIENLREMPEVDAVYLALPVSMHREFTARAAAAGKHVLVEKPMASNSAECAAMIADCRAGGVLLSVAYRCPCEPMHQRLRALVEMGSLGTVERIGSDFGFALKPDDWRQNASLAGGGSLFDVGIYCLNAARYVLRAEPVSHAVTRVDVRDGVEMAIEWTSRFASGVEAHCRSSFRERFEGNFRVTGSGGVLELLPAFSHREAVKLSGTVREKDGLQRRVSESTPAGTPNQFRLEAEHLAHCARTGDPLITPGEDGLADMRAMEAIYAAAGIAA